MMSLSRHTPDSQDQNRKNPADVITAGGVATPLVVGRLPTDLVQLLAARIETVLLHPQTAQKIRFKHRILVAHNSLIPSAFESGWVGIA
jgi:hypothetical protein